jgi:hypothetical protein
MVLVTGSHSLQQAQMFYTLFALHNSSAIIRSDQTRPEQNRTEQNRPDHNTNSTWLPTAATNCSMKSKHVLRELLAWPLDQVQVMQPMQITSASPQKWPYNSGNSGCQSTGCMVWWHLAK